MDELIEILTKIHPDVDFLGHEALVDKEVLDSFDIVGIIASVYDVFGVRIPPLEIVPENFNSVTALYDLITRLIDE